LDVPAEDFLANLALADFFRKCRGNNELKLVRTSQKDRAEDCPHAPGFLALCCGPHFRDGNHIMSVITLFANRATFDHFTCEWSYHAICE
jgi:hypothetical protein